MKTQHTPLPWYTPDKLAYGADTAIYLEAGDGRDIALVRDHNDRAKANAELIVKAVNSHYELLEALKAALPVLIEAREQWSNGEDAYTSAEELVTQAIQKAQ